VIGRSDDKGRAKVRGKLREIGWWMVGGGWRPKEKGERRTENGERRKERSRGLAEGRRGDGATADGVLTRKFRQWVRKRGTKVSKCVRMCVRERAEEGRENRRSGKEGRRRIASKSLQALAHSNVPHLSFLGFGSLLQRFDEIFRLIFSFSFSPRP
jgi:hypothetical protein